jgi:type II secretory pathway pseudopilin PulG
MRSSAVHKTIPAFTLLELLVGMIVSGLVLAATFSAYRIVTRQYAQYCKTTESTVGLSGFLSQLERDVANATEAYALFENAVQLVHATRTVDYRFSENYVLRSSAAHIDTFHVSVPAIHTFRKTEKASGENLRIDELRVVLRIDGKKEEKLFLLPQDARSELESESYGH